MQARANLFQGGGESGVLVLGRHPICFDVEGAMVTDWTQGTPPQSFPAGIVFASVQAPDQLAGGSKGVCSTPGPSAAQLAAAAVIFAGGTHDPLVGPHVQTLQGIGPFR